MHACVCVCVRVCAFVHLHAYNMCNPSSTCEISAIVGIHVFSLNLRSKLHSCMFVPYLCSV